MNRPNIEDYDIIDCFGDRELDLVSYGKDLDIYCDELKKENAKLKKAFHRACSELQDFSYSWDEEYGKSSEQWEEELFK